MINNEEDKILLNPIDFLEDHPIYNVDLKEEMNRASKDCARVIQTLSSIITKWIVNVSKSAFQDPHSQAENACAALYRSGSSRLGLITKNSDIDLICITPDFVDRSSHYFIDLVELLKMNSSITSIIPITEAYVPLIKMKIHNISTDLLLAKVPLKYVKNKNIFNEINLEGLDNETIRTINTYINNSIICELSPKTFLKTLYIIKHWAKQRGIYSNKLGYLGGIAWSLLVAKVCQLFPNLKESELTIKFFQLFSCWKWPFPVIIKDYPKIDQNNDLFYQNWNPKSNSHDSKHLMPIISPAFPCVNTAYNVSKSTFQVIVNELKRANHLILQMEVDNLNRWDMIFEKIRFDLPFNIKIDALSNEDNSIWEEFIESKLRIFIQELEKINFKDIRPYCHVIHGKCSGYKRDRVFIIGIENGEKSVIDLREAWSNFNDIVLHNKDNKNKFSLLISHLNQTDILDLQK